MHMNAHEKNMKCKGKAKERHTKGTWNAQERHMRCTQKAHGMHMKGT
jgi:hypothetical protein